MTKAVRTTPVAAEETADATAATTAKPQPASDAVMMVSKEEGHQQGNLHEAPSDGSDVSAKWDMGRERMSQMVKQYQQHQQCTRTRQGVPEQMVKTPQTVCFIDKAREAVRQHCRTRQQPGKKSVSSGRTNTNEWKRVSCAFVSRKTAADSVVVTGCDRV